LAQTHKKYLFDLRSVLLMLSISACYLVSSYYLSGLRSDHIFLVALVNILFFTHIETRKLITGLSIFILYWILFDYMKAFPNYTFSDVHIKDLYDFEKSLFGFEYHGKIISFNEYWLLNHNKFLDVLCGLFYLMWIPVPLGFAIYLFYKKRSHFYFFALTFFLVNLLGFIVYYTYPAAPPWYVQNMGFTLDTAVKGNTAGLARFDSFFNINLFGDMYKKSSNVFGAMPSLHCSYPVIVLYFGLRNRLGLINILFFLIMIGIWFSSVYTSHHYVLDVIAGVICAITGILFFKYVLEKRIKINNL